VQFTPPLIIDETEVAEMCRRFGRGPDRTWEELSTARGAE
jgi:4-aminobutyrate--pyruvate transaminase